MISENIVKKICIKNQTSPLAMIKIQDVSTWNDKNIKFSQFLNQNTIKNVKLFVYLALRTTHLPNSVKNQHRLFCFDNFLCICIYTHTYKKKYLTIFLVGNICLYCLRFFLFFIQLHFLCYIFLGIFIFYRILHGCVLFYTQEKQSQRYSDIINVKMCV